MPYNIQLPINFQQKKPVPTIWNPSTAQFEYEPHTPPIWNSPNSNVVKLKKDEIEDIPTYPNVYFTPEVKVLLKTTKNTTTRKTHHRIPNHMIPKTYENPKYDPYIHMGILYKYSLRLLEKSKSLDKLEPLIDRYKQLLKIDISMPYLEKQDNIIHKIFINTINNQIKEIQNIKYTPEESKYNLLLKVEFNKEIHNDIKELSMLNERTMPLYRSKFDAFNEKYFTDGIIEMLDPLYINNKNNNKHGTIYEIKKDLFKINKDILKKYNKLTQTRVSTHAITKRTTAKNNVAKRKKTQRTASKSAKLFNAVLGKAI
jgi:hypothetical protein